MDVFTFVFYIHKLLVLVNVTSVLLFYFEEKKKKEVESFIKFSQGLPWWLSGKEPACQCRRHKSDLWYGRIPHATEQLGLCATSIEPVTTEPHVLQLPKPRHPRASAPQQKKPLQWEVHAARLESSSPCSLPEKSPCNSEDPAQLKINKYN